MLLFFRYKDSNSRMSSRLQSTVKQRKRWRKTANDLAEAIGPEPTSEDAGQKEDMLATQAKIQIRFLVRTMQYPIMDKLNAGLPASCPCGHNFKIKGRAQERVHSHLRSHWPYSHIGFGYHMCKEPLCVQYYKRSDHLCKCSSKHGHKSGRKRNNYPMRIATPEGEGGEESGDSEEGAEEGEPNEAQTDYESDEESYEKHEQERKKNKEAPRERTGEKQESAVKKAVEGMKKKWPEVRVRKFGIKRKRNLRPSIKTPICRDWEDSSAEETTTDDSSQEEIESEGGSEPPEEQAEAWRKRVEKRHKSWHQSDEEWIPEGKKEKTKM